MKISPRLIGRAALPVAAVGLIGFAVAVAQRPPENLDAAPIAAPAQPSGAFASAVAAVGLVEPAGEIVAVATEAPGVVREVLVQPGDQVERGAPLFRLDARVLDAQIAAARAAVQVAQVQAADAASRAALFDQVGDARAISADERDRARFAAEAAAANARLAAADLNRLEVERARLTVRAPIAGEVLAVNVRVGEYAGAGALAEPLIAMGDTRVLHVRVQIDEEDVSRVSAGARAEGALRGAGDRRAPLTFLRFEPQAVPKQNLTGGAERVDTRVVEAIYALDPEALPAFVGQQMDVFVEAAPFGVQARAGAQP